MSICQLHLSIIGCSFVPGQDLTSQNFGCPWISYPCISTHIHGFPWVSIDIHRHPWTSMDIHGLPWICPWISIDVNGDPLISIGINGRSWLSTDIHASAQRRMDIREVGYTPCQRIKKIPDCCLRVSIS